MARTSFLSATLMVLLLSVPLFAQSAEKQPAPGVLSATEAAAILPQTVFYRGQSATIQGRNSGGVRMKDGKLILMTLVDSSGYSSAIQQTYQAYLFNEVPLVFGGQTLPPGAYGFGFTAGDHLVIMDIGGNEILHGTTTRDGDLKHPVPLQVVEGPSSAPGYRLYLGRSYVPLEPAGK